MANKTLRPGSNFCTELPPRPEPEKRPEETLTQEWIDEYDRTPASHARLRAEQDSNYDRKVRLLLKQRGVIR
jgi:hypothetical protein